MSLQLGWVCSKCGYMMAAQGDHDTTAGCPALFVSGGVVSVGQTIWGSEEARKILRYDRAVELLRKLENKIGGDLETALFLAEEPTKAEPRFTFNEITPEEAQRRYLKSMREPLK